MEEMCMVLFDFSLVTEASAISWTHFFLDHTKSSVKH